MYVSLTQTVQSLMPTRNSRSSAPPPHTPPPLALAPTYLGDGEVGSDLVAKLLVTEEHQGKAQREGGEGGGISATIFMYGPRKLAGG